MSEDNNYSDPFDIDFDSLNADNPPENVADAPFDLENPFGDDLAASSEEGVSADNPYLNDASVFDDSSSTNSITDGTEEETTEPKEDEKPGKKKGFLGGILGGKKAKVSNEKKEKAKTAKPKKEKGIKEKKPAGESAPRDLGTILCIAFSVFLLVSLLMVNIAGFLTAGGSIMQTLCFLGAFNLVGLAAAAVPLLFYKFPQERTLPNVMLGIAAVAMFTGVLIAVVDFYHYSFIMTP